MADNMIQLKGEFQRKELAAAAGISPGHLVERDSSGEFAVHSTASGPHGSCFAVENELEGSNPDVDYTADERVQVNYQVKGNEVMAILAAVQNVAIGAFLESAGDGTLQALTAHASGSGTDRQPVGVALEAVDLSGSGAVDTPIKIEIV